MKDFQEKLKKMGLKVIKKVEAGIDYAKSTVDNTLLQDQLKRRFNLENPYRFMVYEANSKPSLLQTLAPLHAKRYEEDNTFVFFGTPEHNQFTIDEIVQDLADESMYQILAIEAVMVRVSLNDLDYDVNGTAVVCKSL